MNAHMWNLKKSGIDDLISKAEIETQMYRTVFWTLCVGGDDLGEWH